MEGVLVPRWLKAKLKIGAVVLLLLCLGAWFRIGNHELGIRNIESVIPNSEFLIPVGSVQLFEEPEAGIVPLLDAINKAQNRVDVFMYLFTNQQLAEALVNAEKRGVRVRVLLEDKPYGGARTPKEIKERLVVAGAEVRLCPPRFQFCHAKFMIVDDGAWLMTANWTKAAFTKNREVLIKFTASEAVKFLSQVFEADWRGLVFRSRLGPIVTSPETSRSAVQELITGAQKEILIATEVWEDDLVEDLIRQAENRGVTVRLLLPYKKKSPDGFLPRETRMLKKPYLHEKVMIIDGKIALVGSLNMTANSFDQNREVSVILNEPVLVDQLRTWWLRDWGKAILTP